MNFGTIVQQTEKEKSMIPFPKSVTTQLTINKDITLLEA